MILYYDRAGNPMERDEWAKTREDREAIRVAETTLPDGKWVSTVWLGLNHAFGGSPPEIFETMVFPEEGEWGELECERYSTEEQALAGHKRIVEKWSAS